MSLVRAVTVVIFVIPSLAVGVAKQIPASSVVIIKPTATPNTRTVRSSVKVVVTPRSFCGVVLLIGISGTTKVWKIVFLGISKIGFFRARASRILDITALRKSLRIVGIPVTLRKRRPVSSPNTRFPELPTQTFIA